MIVYCPDCQVSDDFCDDLCAMCRELREPFCDCERIEQCEDCAAKEQA